jgi:hypothetical protein
VGLTCALLLAGAAPILPRTPPASAPARPLLAAHANVSRSEPNRIGTTSTTATRPAAASTGKVTSTTRRRPVGQSPPTPGGYFRLVPPGRPGQLPSGQSCRSRVHYSTWEPRPDNTKRNHVMPDPAAVHAAFAARPRAAGGDHDPRWDRWLLARVDGQFTGRTDEIFQWAACKWGLPDDLLRAIAEKESTWYQYLTYRSGRAVPDYGSGDVFSSPSAASKVYCDFVARHGHDYQRDLGSGICPKTFSIVGVMAWQDPGWGTWRSNQNGVFPFNRNSTAFAVDYLGSQLRGCYEGWEGWLATTGTMHYAAGDLWGCVGAWFAGEWHSGDADDYSHGVRRSMASRPWLDPGWPRDKPGCSGRYGCPGADRL